jgi:hypothetical protein
MIATDCCIREKRTDKVFSSSEKKTLSSPMETFLIDGSGFSVTIL